MALAGPAGIRDLKPWPRVSQQRRGWMESCQRRHQVRAHGQGRGLSPENGMWAPGLKVGGLCQGQSLAGSTGPRRGCPPRFREGEERSDMLSPDRHKPPAPRGDHWADGAAPPRRDGQPRQRGRARVWAQGPRRTRWPWEVSRKCRPGTGLSGQGALGTHKGNPHVSVAAWPSAWGVWGARKGCGGAESRAGLQDREGMSRGVSLGQGQPAAWRAGRVSRLPSERAPAVWPQTTTTEVDTSL